MNKLLSPPNPWGAVSDDQEIGKPGLFGMTSVKTAIIEINAEKPGY